MDKHPEIIKDNCRVESLQMGNILDAQDYLGTWHLAIVLDDSQPLERKIHFISFKASNRDETFTEQDYNKIAPAFIQTEIPQDPEISFRMLKEYFEMYKSKKKPVQVEEKKQGPGSQRQHERTQSQQQ
jgi:hypothetical protein